MAIEYLKDHLISTLKAKAPSKSKQMFKPNITVKDIHFVVTVPAIWEDKAKLIMREAAMEVRLQKSEDCPGFPPPLDSRRLRGSIA